VRRLPVTQRMPGWLIGLATAGTLPTESDDVRLRKATLTLLVAMITLAGIVWGTMYAVLGRRLSAVFPYGYSAFSMLNLLYLAAAKRYALFRFIQLLLILWLPFLLQWSLGGFVASGAVMLWAILAPLGALMFDDTPKAARWFIAYLVLTAVSVLLEQPLAASVGTLPLTVVVVFFGLNLGGVSMTMFLVVRYFVQENAKAQERSERLLLNVLPHPIAQRLKRDPTTIADAYAEVTVLFADIVDFTKFSAGIPPRRLVEILNEVFSAFDRLAERHGLEKIKTIGDAYMVVGGLPTPRADHAEAVAEMALDMREALALLEGTIGASLRLRIGIHTGPVVAGVIGRRKFIYDLWGDTVNTASRMESHGLPGTIQMTMAASERLRDRYLFEERGTVEVKGKGPMPTFLLVGRKDTPAPISAVDPPKAGPGRC